MKKIFASLLSFAIILSISVPAFAAESPSAPSSPAVNSGNVTMLTITCTNLMFTPVHNI